MNRRRFLQSIGLAAAVVAVPRPEASIDWDRLERSRSGLSHLDGATIEGYAAVNARLWRTFHEAIPKGAVFDSVHAQLSTLMSALHEDRSSAGHERLCELMSDLLQLAGEIFFDANRYDDAVRCYAAATAAAKEAGHFDLWACSLTRQAFVAMFDAQPDHAVALLDIAQPLALRGDPLLATRHWVSTVRAKALADLGRSVDCERDLDHADLVRSLPGEAQNGGWLRFDGSRLAEERGSCFVRLGQSAKAEDALTEALNGHLSVRRRGLVLADLAETFALRGEVEHACSYGEMTIDLALGGRSGMLVNRLQGLDARLARWATARPVRRFHSRIESLTREGGEGT